jgi:sulfur-carrier protein
MQAPGTSPPRDACPVGFRRGPTTIAEQPLFVPEEPETLMSVTVRIPTTLRTLTSGSSEVQVDGGDVRTVLDALEAAHPGFKSRLLDDEGNLRRFVNVFVADDDVRFLKGLDTPVDDGQTVAIIPAVAGG